MAKLFSGTGVAVVTAFKSDGGLDLDAQGRIFEKLQAAKISYVVLLGSTGEASTVSLEEQKELLEFSKKKLGKKTPIVLGMSGNNSSELINRISEFNLKGVAGLLSATPSYVKPSQDGIFIHFKSICEASPVPVIIYNVPGRTASNINAETTLRIAREIPNAVAIKEASGNLTQVMRIIAEKPEDFKVLSGDDFYALPLIALGAEGLISVLGNAYPEEVSSMVKLAGRNKLKEARKLHYKFLQM